MCGYIFALGMTQYEAEALLVAANGATAKPGTFVLRFSENSPGDYSYCIVESKQQGDVDAANPNPTTTTHNNNNDDNINDDDDRHNSDRNYETEVNHVTIPETQVSFTSLPEKLVTMEGLERLVHLNPSVPAGSPRAVVVEPMEAIAKQYTSLRKKRI